MANESTHLDPRRVESLRIALGIPHKDVGFLLGVQESTVHAWKGGRLVKSPTVAILVELGERALRHGASAHRVRRWLGLGKFPDGTWRRVRPRNVEDRLRAWGYLGGLAFDTVDLDQVPMFRYEGEGANDE